MSPEQAHYTQDHPGSVLKNASYQKKCHYIWFIDGALDG